MHASQPARELFALVVDDNANAANISRALLEAYGWTVDYARDGFEAILRFRARRYDALVLDYCLPGMDGVEVLAWARRNLAETPRVVVVSAENEALLHSRFGGMGVEAFLPKPVEASDLFRALKAA